MNISVNKEEIEFIKDKSADGMICYKVFMKSGAIISIVLLQEKGGEAQACHMLYGSYDDFVKELDLYELEEKVNKAKKAFVSISDNSTYLKNTYENIYLEEEDGTRRLVFFNGDKDNPTDKITFTLYDATTNDIWLMSGAKADDGSDGWEGLKLRLYNQPFTEVRGIITVCIRIGSKNTEGGDYVTLQIGGNDIENNVLDTKHIIFAWCKK